MPLTAQERKDRASATMVGTLGLMLGCFALLALFALTAAASQPGWWTSRGAVNESLGTNDYAAVNQGQAKQFTARAVDELNADLTNNGGAGTNLNSMVYGWQQDYVTNGYNATNIEPADFNVMTVGQLKYIGQQVYTQLIAADYANSYPSWLATTNAGDYSAANIGQLKTVFDFDLTLPRIPLNVSVTQQGTQAFLSWSDPSSNVVSYTIEESTNGGASWTNAASVSGTTTTDTLTGLTSGSTNSFRVIAVNSAGSSNPSTSVISPVQVTTMVGGNYQTALPSTFLSNPLEIHLANLAGTALTGTSVTFNIALGSSGGLATTSGGSTSSTLSVNTDGSGNATVYYQTGAESLKSDLITASAATGGNTVYFVANDTAANVMPVAGGTDHSLAIESNGTVWAWGNNADGQLGDGTTLTRLAPVQITSLSNIVAVAAGDGQSVALKNDGTVWAWGDNEYGQVGDGTTTQRNIPVQVSGLSGMIAVAAGYGHSLALKNDGTVWAWGNNADGELGDQNNLSSAIPVQVSNLSGIIAIATRGYHSLALKSDGTLWAWGYNASGQLGNGTTVSSNFPVQVTGLSATVMAMAAGGYHSVAITSDHKVWTWGDNGFGQLGETIATTNSVSPYQVTLPGSSSNDPVAITAGDYDTLVLRGDGTVDVFGDNEDEELGDGTDDEYQDSPEELSGVANVVAIASGGAYSFIQTSSGASMESWGDNSLGQLGIGTLIDFTGAQTVVGLPSGLAPSFKVTVPMVAAGAYHTLALRADGTVWAWGDDVDGELGNGSSAGNYNMSAPVQVANLTGVKAIAAGDYFSLALKKDGTVWAWGNNYYSGQLGNNSTVNSNVPVQVLGLTGITAIAAGYDFGLALRSDGTVWAWGDGDEGQLGNGSASISLVPVQVSNTNLNSSVIAIAAGWDHSLALKSDGTVWAWGDNTIGELGNGTTVSSKVPVAVSNGMGVTVTAIGAGDHFSIELTSSQTVESWGYDNFGELGDNNSSTETTPVAVYGLNGVQAIAAGWYHAVAVKNDGTVWGWGDGADGELGSGTVSAVNKAPVSVAGLASIVAVSTGLADTFAMDDSGAISSLGSNSDGQLGNGSTSSTSTPVFVSGLNLRYVPYGLSVGDAHSTAVRSDGAFWSWGNNSSGQLGNWTTATALTPAQSTSFTSVAAVASGTSFSSALKTDGSLWAWGANGSGQLGDGTTANSNSPVQNNSLTGLLMVAAGASHTVVVKSDNTVWTWGNNSNGQLGNGNTTNQSSPVEVNSTTLNGDAFQVAAGSTHTVALKRDGSVWTWGGNACGQLGNGGTSDSSSPAQLTGLTGIYTAVAAGASHTVALCSDGTVWTWGYNADGELGIGSTSNQSSPAQISGFGNVVAIAATATNTYALKGDGTVWAWGGNTNGQLGNGTSGSTPATSPVQITALSNVIALATGSSANHMLALETDGSVWAWGDNTNGDLGNGTTTQQNTPIQVGTINLLQYPNASVSSPSGTIFSASSNIPLSVSVSESQGFIKEVDYYQGTTLIGSATSAPFTFLWNNVPAGSYAITAVAIDANGSETTSTSIHLTVVASGYSGVVANNNDSYVLRSDGTIWAWGQNSSGDLGAGSLSEQFSPVWTAGLTNVISLAAGGAHAVALTSSGTVWTWGDNVDGDLGLGTSTAHSIPQPVSSLSNITGVAAGTNHTVALAADGTVWVWGDNTYGQLGTGNNTAQSSPVQISPALLNGVIAIAAANNQTMALKADGTVWMWGSNAQGQLGNGTTTSSFNTPTEVSSLTEITAISCGNQHAAALAANGNVYIWGDNTEGELGNGTTTQSTSPIQVSSLSNIISIQCGAGVSFAIKADGTQYAWGNNASGQLGLGSATSSFTTPQTTANWSGVTQYACGAAHTLASKSDGTVLATGSQSNGQLGNGVQSSSNLTAPVAVTSLEDFLGVSAGDAHTLAFKYDGSVWAWGDNASGQLGNDTTTNSSVPVPTGVISNAVGVSAGTGFSLAVGSDGTVWAWGSNSYGQLGANTSFTQIDFPSPVAGITNAIQLSAGASHSVALREDGTVWAWGRNSEGELGNGSTSTSLASPAQASGLANIIEVAAGGYHVVALKNDGTVWTWGSDSNGQLGDNSTTNNATPAQISTSYLSGIIAVAAGANFSAALKSDGTVWTWGDNADGELGSGANTDLHVPTEIAGLSNVVAMVAGASALTVLKSDGTLWTWGLNSSGQLGLGSTTSQNTPTQVTGAPSGLVYLAGGSSANHALALLANQAAYAWGDNTDGDLGDGTATQRNSPTAATAVSIAPVTYTMAPTITLTEPDGAVLLP